MMNPKGRDGTENRYKADDGTLRWERITDILADVCDSYLGTIEGIEYQNASGVPGGALGLFGEAKGSDADPHMIGSQLLKSISALHSTAIKHTISGKPEDEVLYRLSKFAPMASKLSDRYAMEDRMYETQWHEDILNICEAIQERNRELQ